MDPYAKPGYPPPAYNQAVGFAQQPGQPYPAAPAGQPYPATPPAQAYPATTPAQAYPPTTVAQGYPPPTAAQPYAVAPPAHIPVAQPTGGVWSLLCHGTQVQLISVASKKAVRIHNNGTVDGNGGGGLFARFIVERSPSPDILVLRHVHNQMNVLGVHDNKLMALPHGAPQGQLRVHVHPNQNVSLESISYPGEHVGILPSGAAKPPKNTHQGAHGQFTVQLPPKQAQAQPPQPAVATAPAHSVPGAVVSTPGAPPLFWHGNRVQLMSKASGHALRIKADGSIDGNGGGGQFAQFTVEHRRENIFCLRNVHNPALCLCIKDATLTVGNGCQFCEMRAQKIGDHITLESVMFPSQFVGVIPNGSTKPPSHTRRGPHGQFRVVAVSI